MVATPIETITPAYAVDDHVRFQGRTGVITEIYRNGDQPLWYGSRRLVHTHCYKINTDLGPTWGWVDTELTRDV